MEQMTVALLKDIQGESKKVWLAAFGENLYFFVQLSCIVFFQYFLEFFWPTTKSAKHFSLSKSKVQKSKNVDKHYFYLILKFGKYCFIFRLNFVHLELQNILRRKELENLNNFSLNIRPERNNTYTLFCFSLLWILREKFP